MIDLHVHTTCSDGIYSPMQVVELFTNMGYKEISITDHETFEAYYILKENQVASRVRLIPGMEIEVEFEKKRLHMLAYYFNTNNNKLCNLMKQVQKHRQQEAILLLRKLRNLDNRVYERVLTKGKITISSILRELANCGYGRTMQEVYDNLFVLTSKLRVNEFFPSVSEYVDVIQDAGGYLSLAHPFRQYENYADLRCAVSRLVSLGVKGIECFHPEHNKLQTEQCLRLAKVYGLKITGGSDFHRGKDIFKFDDRMLNYQI